MVVSFDIFKSSHLFDELLFDRLSFTLNHLLLVCNFLAKWTYVVVWSIDNIIVIDFLVIWPLDISEIICRIPSDFTTIVEHSIQLFFRYITLDRLWFRFWNKLFLSPILLLLFLDENFDKLFKVKLKLVGISFFCFFESIKGYYMLTETVLYLASQHQFLFIEL